jgi:hypothetical protein
VHSNSLVIAYSSLVIRKSKFSRNLCGWVPL